jgi:hypothetical protein
MIRFIVLSIFLHSAPPATQSVSLRRRRSKNSKRKDYAHQVAAALWTQITGALSAPAVATRRLAIAATPRFSLADARTAASVAPACTLSHCLKADAALVFKPQAQSSPQAPLSGRSLIKRNYGWAI